MSDPPADDTQWQSGRITLTAAPGRQVAVRPDLPVLGVSFAPGDNLPFSEFDPVEAPLLLDLSPAPPPSFSVLGAPAPPAPAATLSYSPAPDEAGVYLLLQTIQTPDGTIYDVSLPLAEPAGDEAMPSFSVAPTLRFPVRQLVFDHRPPAAPESGLLGGPDVVAFDMLGDAAFRRVVQILRAPFAPAVQSWVAEREGAPVTYQVTPDGELGRPLVSAADWRALFPPGRPYRTLLFIHGFLSNAQDSLPKRLMQNLAPHYDVLIAYSHPTIATGPDQNAADLIAGLPADVCIVADIVAHSRGGLVARSLVELVSSDPRISVERVFTCGSPHGGTLLGEFHRWDRLASIGLTAASWLMAASGVATPLAFAPKLIEYLLRAGGQLFFDLPGVNALDPASPFIARLNLPGDPATIYRVPYAAVIADFDPTSIVQAGFRDALSEMVVDAFAGAPNDLVVNTDSMTSIDLPLARQLSGWIHKTNTNHFTYFDQPDVIRFAREFFFGE